MKITGYPPAPVGFVTVPERKKQSKDEDDAPAMELSFGLHLMGAGRAKGKTITSLALAEWLSDVEVPYFYAYIMEPRSELPASSLIGGEKWTLKYRELLGNARRGVLILDSLTYLVPMLDEILQIEDSLSKVTYKGGLSPKDILGILVHDEIAKRAEVAVVATINSELMPTMDVFEGACEGSLNLLQPGVFTQRDRKTRSTVNVTVPKQYMTAAAELLGYDKGQISGLDSDIV